MSHPDDELRRLFDSMGGHGEAIAQLLHLLHASLQPFSDQLVELLDGHELQRQALQEAYLRWAMPAALLLRALEERERTHDLTLLIPKIDHLLDLYLDHPGPEQLSQLAECWFDVRRASIHLLVG